MTVFYICFVAAMGILGDKLSYLPGEEPGMAGMAQEPIYERRGEQIYRQPYNRMQEVRQS